MCCAKINYFMSPTPTNRPPIGTNVNHLLQIDTIAGGYLLPVAIK
jgi:hypothetical protein